MDRCCYQLEENPNLNLFNLKDHGNTDLYYLVEDHEDNDEENDEFIYLTMAPLNLVKTCA